MGVYVNSPADDLLREQAYLVERGVPALATVGACREADAEQVPTMLALGGTYSPGAVLWVVAGAMPFVTTAMRRPGGLWTSINGRGVPKYPWSSESGYSVS